MERWVEYRDLREQTNAMDEAAGEERIQDLLNGQIEELQRTLDNLKFKVSEYEVEAESDKETLPDVEYGTSYFEIVGALENDLMKVADTIETQKKIAMETRRRNALARSKLKKLNNEISRQEDQISSQKTREKRTKDGIIDLETKIQSKESELRMVFDLCESVNEELEEKAKQLPKDPEKYLANLRIQERYLEDQLREKLQLITDLEKSIKEINREADLEIKELEKRLKKAESVSTWMGPRKLSVAKLKTSKQKVTAAVNNMALSTKQERELSQAFKELLGEDDPGDGTGLVACQLIQAEINSFQPILNDGEDIEAYQDFRSQLEKRRRIISRSQTVVEHFLAEGLKSLGE